MELISIPWLHRSRNNDFEAFWYLSSMKVTCFHLLKFVLWDENTSARIFKFSAAVTFSFLIFLMHEQKIQFIFAPVLNVRSHSKSNWTWGQKRNCKRSLFSVFQCNPCNPLQIFQCNPSANLKLTIQLNIPWLFAHWGKDQLVQNKEEIQEQYLKTWTMYNHKLNVY